MAGNMRESSKKNWTSEDTVGEIKVGSLQRIADATEAMARSYQQLIDERDKYKRWWKEGERRTNHLERSASGLRGHITRLKNRYTPEPTDDARKGE